MDRGRQKDDVNYSRVPVFVFPSNLIFNANDRNQLKQILTIYNPYEFPIKFKVLSNAATFYNVRPDEATISSKNSLDLIIRVTMDDKSDSTTPLKHKFRIQIYHQHTKQQVGQRDVESIIHFGNLPAHLAPSREFEGSMSSSSTAAEGFQQFPSGSSGGMGSSKDSGSASGSSSAMAIFPQAHSQPNYVVLIVAIVCIIGLLLPYDENCKSNDSSNKSKLESILPSYIHLSVNQKLLFAYALGLVTMVILRP